jgi:hypothetical protein
VLTAKDVEEIYASSQGGAAGGGAQSAGTGSPSTGPFATTAKVEIEDSKGPIPLKREEQIAYMFMSAMDEIERNCLMTLQHACPLNQILTGAYPKGSNVERLKFDPNKTDPNYTYTLATGGKAWEAHANPKKPGLAGFCFMARDIGTTTATINKSGNAGWTDDELMNRGVSGDSFATQ